MEKGRVVSMVVVLALVGLVNAGVAAADQPARRYFDGTTRKLGRGVANILTAPLELVREPYLIGQDDGMLAGVTVGLVRGVGSTVIREAAGIIETVTFPIPIPKNFQPLLTPEFIFANGDWAE